MLLPFDQLTRDGHRTLCVRVREPSRVHRPSEVQDQVLLFCFLNLIHLCLSLLLWLTNFRFILKYCFHSRMKRFLFLSSSTSNLVHSCEIVREWHRLMRSLADVHQPSYFCTDCNHVIASCAEYDLGNMFHVLGRGTLVTLRFLPQDLYSAVEPSYLSFQVFTSSLRLLVMTWLFAADLTMSAATSPKSAKSSSLLLSSCMVKAAKSGVFWTRSSTIWTLCSRLALAGSRGSSRMSWINPKTLDLA